MEEAKQPMHLFDVPSRPDATLLDVLDFQAVGNGAAIWLRQDGRAISFAAARALVDRYAAGLSARRIGAGQVVALVVNPSAEMVLLCLAIARLGAVFTTINTDYKDAFLREALDETQADTVIIDSDLADRLTGLTLARVRDVMLLGDAVSDAAQSTSRLLEAGDAPPPVELSPFDAVQVWWSSGTTGKSKGVVHGHSSLMRIAWHFAKWRIQPGDVLYSCTPVYLGSSWTGTIWPSLVGGVSGAIDLRFSASRFWERVAYYGATHFFTLGAMHMHLWKRPPSPADRAHRVRDAQAIPLTWEQVPEFKARFGIEKMPQGYGTSETFLIFEARDDGTGWSGAALGRAMPHYEVALFDERDRPVPLGEAGEVCVRPREPGVMFLGYFNQPDMTAKAWRNLWHHTGDMAYRDEDGVYYFADRKKDYIRYSGRNISMFEVEAVLAEHPQLEDVCAYGIVSEEMESESELCLALVKKPGCSPSFEEIAGFINRHAPYYFVPRYMLFAESLPRNAHGRLLKNELRNRGLPQGAWDRKQSSYVVER